MVSSGFVSVGFYRCPVCGCRHGDEVQMRSAARPIFGTLAFMGWALCPRDELRAGEGFIALVEVVEEPVGFDTVYEQLDQAERTGTVMHVLLEQWHALFNFPPPAGLPMMFVDQATAKGIMDQHRQSLH